MIERLWVEVNTRINYPVKSILEMENCGKISMANILHKHCVSWFAIDYKHLFSHGIAIQFLVKLHLLKVNVQFWLLFSCRNKGRRRGGMGSHIPHDVMQRNSRISGLDLRHLPSSTRGVTMYREGGRISDETCFGEDPIYSDSTKCSHQNASLQRKIPFIWRYFSWASKWKTCFESALFYIDVSYGLSRS